MVREYYVFYVIYIYSYYYPKVLINSYIVALFVGLPLIGLSELLINNCYVVQDNMMLVYKTLNFKTPVYGRAKYKLFLS